MQIAILIGLLPCFSQAYTVDNVVNLLFWYNSSIISHYPNKVFYSLVSFQYKLTICFYYGMLTQIMFRVSMNHAEVKLSG